MCVEENVRRKKDPSQPWWESKGGGREREGERERKKASFIIFAMTSTLNGQAASGNGFLLNDITDPGFITDVKIKFMEAGARRETESLSFIFIK